MSTNKHCRVLILGSSPARYTAAVYAARGGPDARRFLESDGSNWCDR